MKILIVGLGVIGVIHGWALSKAGVEITHKVRPGKARPDSLKINMDVLDFREGWPEHHQAVYQPKVIEEIPSGADYDLIMVPTKQYQAAAAVADLKDVLPRTDFLLFTANWAGPAEIDALLPRSRYLWGYSVASGGQGPDGLVVTIKPLVQIGELDGADTPRLKRLVEVFRSAGIQSLVQKDIISWLWVHQAVNAGMIGTGLMAGGLGEMAADPEGLRFMVLAVREALGVAAMRGVDLSAYSDAESFLKMSLEETVAFWQDFFQSEHAQRVVTAGHFKGNPEEMKDFFLKVYITGQELGAEMPHLDQIFKAIS